MRISECMSRNVTMASPGQTVEEAARLMAQADAGMLPVAENDRLVGVITDRDIAIRGIGGGQGCEARVEAVMTREVRWCFEDESVEAVLATMGDQQVRRLPVLSREKRLVGIVSLSDLAAHGAPSDAGQALSDIARPGGMHSQTLH